MKYFTKTIFVVVLASAVCSLSTVWAQTLPETAKIIPPETVLLVNVDNFSQLKQQYEKIAFYKLYKDPVMTPFIEDFKAKCREKIQELDENDIIKTLFNTDVLPQGRVAFALVFDEQTKDADEPPVLFISQWGENIEKIKDAIKKMVEKNIEKGGHQKRSEDYQGVSIETSIDENSSVLNYCFIDDCHMASTNLDVLKFVVAHIKGATSPTLAGDSDYTATMKTIGPYHDADLYINIKQIIKMAISEDTDEHQVQAAIKNLGLDNVTSIGYSIGLAKGASNSYCGKAFLKINGPKKGICKMLEAESAVFNTPRFAPVSTFSAIFYNLNISKAYNELANILNSFSPAYAAMMYGLDLPPSPDGEPGVKFKDDIIDHLGSQIVIIQSVDKPLSANSKEETIVALAVNNRAALEKSMSLLHSKMIAPNNPDARRELLGHTIYLIDLSAMQGFFPGQRTPMQTQDSTNVSQAPKLAFTVTDTHLIFATESTVERAIRTLGSGTSVSAGPAKWFNEAKSAIPSVVGLACFEDTSVSFELLWSKMKESQKSGTQTNLMELNPFLMLTQMGFNFQLLPGYDSVRKYFGLFTSYGISTPEGFFFEFKDQSTSGASN